MACGAPAAVDEHGHRAGRPPGAAVGHHPRVRPSRRLPRSSWSSVAPATERAPVSRLMRAWIARWASPVRRDSAATSARRSSRRRSRRSWAVSASGREGAAAGAVMVKAASAGLGAGSGVGEQLQRVAGLGGLQDVVVAARARPQGVEGLGGLAALALGDDRLALGLEHERVVALLLDPGGELLEPRVRGQEEVRHLRAVAPAGGAADEAPDDLAEEQLGARGRRVDADAQPRDVDALGDHQHGHEPRAGARGEAGDARRGVGRVGGHDRGPLAGDAGEARGEPLGVVLVDRHHEAAGVGVGAGAQVGQAGVRVAQHVGDPVAVGVERRAQPARGLPRPQHDGEVRPARGGRRSSTPCRRRRCGRSPAGTRRRRARPCSRSRSRRG